VTMPCVSPYQPEHEAAVLALTQITCTNVDLALELAKPYARITVAQRGSEQPRAYALTWCVADELQLIDLATAPDTRRHGLARALVSEAIAFGRLKQCRYCLLEVRQSNVAARALYDAFGFRVTRERKGYYSDGETACEMELML
jgi:ribosomal protein S18 acetylase RimI-like enzyme